MSWGTSFKNFGSNWLTPYSWTPQRAPLWMKALVGYSKEELYPHVYPKCHPFIMNENQYDAYLMAKGAQKHFKWGLRYLLVPMVIAHTGKLVLKPLAGLGNMFLNELPSSIKNIVDSFVNKVKSVFSSKLMRYIIIPEIISDILHTHGPAFYKNIRPMSIAFMRPFFERMLPSVNEILEDEGVVVSARRIMVVDNPNAFLSWMGRFGSVVLGRYNASSVPDALVPDSYGAGEYVVSQLEKFLRFFKDILESTTQILPSLASPKNFVETCFKLKEYFSSQITWLSENAGTPTYDWLTRWSKFLVMGLKDNVIGAHEWIAKGGADAMGLEHSWARGAVKAVIYVPMVSVAVITAASIGYASVLSVKAHFRALRDSILPIVPPSFRHIFQRTAPAALIPPVGLQADLTGLLGHPVAQHQADWLAMPQASRTFLNQESVAHPVELHALLAGMGLNVPQETVVAGLAVNP